jgi:hypothetical protein
VNKLNSADNKRNELLQQQLDKVRNHNIRVANVAEVKMKNTESEAQAKLAVLEDRLQKAA